MRLAVRPIWRRQWRGGGNWWQLRFVMGMRVLAVGRAVERAYWEKAVGAGLERGR